jgi:Ring finger domain
MSYRHLDNVQCVHTNYLFKNFVFDENSEHGKLPDEEECDLCLEPLSEQKCVILNPCKHVFHQKCYFDHEYSQRLRQPNTPTTCPICRSETENVWNLAVGAVQHASIHPIGQEMRTGYGASTLRDSNIKLFLTDVCNQGDFTFASRLTSINRAYHDRYNLLVDVVHKNLLRLQSGDLAQSLHLDGISILSLYDYTHYIIQAFKGSQTSFFIQKCQTANKLFYEGSDIYEQCLKDISDGNAWPIALYMHMQQIHEVWPNIVPNIRTLGINSSTGQPLLQQHNIEVPVVNKQTTLICIQLLLQAFQYKNSPIASRTRSHRA